MEGPVRLGGNIELFGIENFDGATVIVLKKIIGNYARKFSEKGLDRLSISFAENGVSVEAVRQGNTVSAQSQLSNMFFSVDSALKDIDRQL